jgi:hypothetical protein
MPRTVVPPKPASKRAADAPAGGDQLPEKLVKYIPGETLAFFVPVAAALGSDRKGWLVAVTIVAAIGTVAYLWNSASSTPATERPLPHFYVLAVIAFAAWAIGTSPNIADLISVDDVVAGVILALAVFLVPLADGILNRVLGPDS